MIFNIGCFTFEALYVIEAQKMKQEEIINGIIFNKELSNSPLLISWIQESEENRDVYIAYKNSSALIQKMFW